MKTLAEPKTTTHPPLLDQFDNLRSNGLMHSKRRMQTIQPQILIHRNTTHRLERSRRGRSILICSAKCRGVLIRAGLRVSAGMLDNTRKDLVCVEDKGRDVVVLLSQRL